MRGRRRRHTNGHPAPRIGLALAGGGPLGAIYEIGALCALDESLDGLRLTDCDAYVGVSAGGFIAAGLANGITPRELCAVVHRERGRRHDILHPDMLMRPAWGEFARRLAMLPALVGAGRLALSRSAAARCSSAFERLGRALPTGLFSNGRLEAQMRRVFSAPGRSNDFRQLRRKLVLVATDLDTGEAAPFGQPGWDHVPISRAMQASAALPGLFPPVRDRRPALRRRRAEEDAACLGAARRRGRPADVPEPAGALRRHRTRRATAC